MPGLRDIKRRIKSVQSTRKITRSMQLVSAAKMRKAQQAVLSSRMYSTLAWELILNLSHGKEISAALLKQHPAADRVAVLLLSTNSGLVGSLNSNLLAVLRGIEQREGVKPEIIAYGKKGREAVLRGGEEMIADFEKQEHSIGARDIYPVSELLADLYKTGRYRKILIIYNHFISTLVQKPTIKQLLPFAPSIVQSAAEGRRKNNEDDGEGENGSANGYDYIYEPTPKMVFQHLLPRILESQIYQTVLESNASEHSARMIMMKNATDAAGDLIDDLTLTYNKIRQNKITTELAEITAGKIALE